MTADASTPGGAAALPEGLALLEAGGFAAWRGLFTPDDLELLRADARQVRRAARRSQGYDVRADEGRGGAPARACTLAAASPAHFRLHDAPALRAFLTAAVGRPVTPTGGGSFTWYEQAGDFLALHRDIDGCDATLVTCLAASPGAGRLIVYPRGIGRPLSAVSGPGVPVALEPGDAALLLGGFVPHAVEPQPPGESRLVSLMCYRLEPPAAG